MDTNNCLTLLAHAYAGYLIWWLLELLTGRSEASIHSLTLRQI